MENAVLLTKKLVSIPSYVGSDCDEKEIADFLFDYLKQFSWLQVKKQPVANGRYNIIAKDKYPTTLLISGHLDTVQPRNEWKTDPFAPTQKGNKLYGLGITDMKGAIAAFLVSLEQFKETKGLMLLFYIDEEYDFLGMKKFLAEYKTLRPSFIVSLDGYDMSIGNGCRGLIEMSFVVKGVTGHASRPYEGINAITESVAAITSLTETLKKEYSSKELGTTTCNVAFLEGGLDMRKTKQDVITLGKEGNNIANIARFVLDIRPAANELTAKKVLRILKEQLKKRGLTLESYAIRHDLGSWITQKSAIKKNAVWMNSMPYADIRSYGYIDTQMLWKAFKKVPCITYGPGIQKLAHKPNEYLLLPDLKKAEKIYVQLIERSIYGKRS